MSQIETPVTQLPIPAEAIDHGPGRGRGGPGGGGPGGRGPRWWARRAMGNDAEFRRGLVPGLIVSAAWLIICLAYISTYVGWDAMVYLLPHELAAVLSAVFATLGVLWLVHPAHRPQPEQNLPRRHSR